MRTESDQLGTDRPTGEPTGGEHGDVTLAAAERHGRTGSVQRRGLRSLATCRQLAEAARRARRPGGRRHGAATPSAAWPMASAARRTAPIASNRSPAAASRSASSATRAATCSARVRKQAAVRRCDQCREAWGSHGGVAQAGGVVEEPSGGGYEAGGLRAVAAPANSRCRPIGDRRPRPAPTPGRGAARRRTHQSLLRSRSTSSAAAALAAVLPSRPWAAARIATAIGRNPSKRWTSMPLVARSTHPRAVPGRPCASAPRAR